MKKVLSFLMIAVLGFALISCDGKGEVQGITDEHIIIGNTAATSGVFAGVGVPFNLAMEVVFDDYNARTEGRKIKFIHYDDGFDGEQGLAYTKKLVEEDKVFALVGHFGTNTVEATMDYLLESGIPMVYGVTGVNSLYYEGATKGKPGHNILSVQPIYRTEGRMMVARALHEELFGAEGNAKLGDNDKIVVLYFEDDAGISIKAGIEDEVKNQNIASNRVVYVPFTAATALSDVQTALDANPGVILLSANQAPATAAATALREKNSTVPVLSSYVNAAGVFTPAMAEGEALPYNVYANAWVDIVKAGAPGPTADQVGGDGTLAGWAFDLALLAGFTEEYWAFVKMLNDSDREGANLLWADPYAMAGYVAAMTFVQILERVDNFDKLDWNGFIKLAESAPLSLPMAGTIDWNKGNRFGLDSLALTKLQLNAAGAAYEFAKIREIESLADVNKK